MLIATLLLVIGLTVGAWAATTRGYRLSGVVVVSLLAVYTLIDFAAFPVFVLSAVLAYVGVTLLAERWLVYGRRLLLASIVVGAVVPVSLFVLINAGLGRSLTPTELEFLGSILPGIAAYNFYRADAERRLPELVASLALFAGLVAVGVLAIFLWGTTPCTICALLGRSPAAYTTPLVLAAGSDVAGLLGLRTSAAQPGVGSVVTVTFVVVLGLALAEFVRARWGLRPAGVIALPLVALFALRAWWVAPLYLAILIAAYASIQVVHARTLLYGRALLSVSTVLGVLLAVPLLVAFGLTDALAVFFAGFLAGIGAYNLHLVAPRERAANVAVSAGLFVAVFAVARTLITPLPDGLGTPVSWLHVLVGVAALAAATWALVDLERVQPSPREIERMSPLVEGVER